MAISSFHRLAVRLEGATLYRATVAALQSNSDYYFEPLIARVRKQTSSKKNTFQLSFKPIYIC
jgi:hypothetical protein